MTELEKVIKGLEHTQSNMGDINLALTHCPECPYYNISDCEAALISDALNQLKKYEPRVLKLSEINKHDIVYYEIKKFRDIKPAIVLHTNAVTHHRFLTHDEFFDFSVYIPDDIKYEKTWRCWNTKPNEEERKTIEWYES